MKKIEKNNIVTLNNIQYVVVSVINLDNIEYYYLISIKEEQDIKFCRFYGDDFYEVFDTDLILNLFRKVAEIESEDF